MSGIPSGRPFNGTTPINHRKNFNSWRSVFLFGITVPILLILLGACTLKEIGNAMRSFETEELRSVTVEGVPYAVERRTRSDDPESADSYQTVAVWATVQGTPVYCGTTREECAAAISKQLKQDRKDDY